MRTGRTLFVLAIEASLAACLTSNDAAPHGASGSQEAGAEDVLQPTLDARSDEDWHNCNGTSDPRSCASVDMHPFDAARGCFVPELVHVPELCTVCTMEFASASIGPVCGVDPENRLFMFTMRPDLRLEAPGWRFGHRRDRGVYKDLEPDLLTDAESAACDQAAALWFDGGFEDDICVSPSDGGDAASTSTCDAGADAACSCTDGGVCVSGTCRPGCFDDNECADAGLHCNLTSCLPPPGCYDRCGNVVEADCSTVCYGFCE
jgi:hypothetical protein